MRVLVTGAAGLLGRSVVSDLLRRGHSVRALVRPAANVAHLAWPREVEIVRADLRVVEGLRRCFDGIDALVHLAATIFGAAEVQFEGTVVATERLLAAMATSSTSRLLLASSFSVYDWRTVSGTLDESAPTDPWPYSRDGYAVAKVWQERVVRRASDENAWSLTVLRPGLIWGPGNEWPIGIGIDLRATLAAIGLRRELPLTFVGNCSDCFATALDEKRASGETYNVVDGFRVTARQYASLYAAWTARKAPVATIPYRLGLAVATAAWAGVGTLAKRDDRRREPKLPGFLVPHRYEARFKPVQYSNEKVRRELGWQPPLSMQDCVARTFKGSHESRIRR